METMETHPEVPTKVEPQNEHRWLQRFAGEWTYEHEAVMKPGEAPVKCSGTESVRSLGDLWIVAEGRGEMPCGGGTASMVLTIGYDPEKAKFVGTWIGSMMTHMWTYEGALDASEKTLTLETEGPSCKGDGGTAKYQDIYEFIADDHRTLRSRIQGEDGQWNEFMVAHYYRKK